MIRREAFPTVCLGSDALFIGIAKIKGMKSNNRRTLMFSGEEIRIKNDDYSNNTGTIVSYNSGIRNKLIKGSLSFDRFHFHQERVACYSVRVL